MMAHGPVGLGIPSGSGPDAAQADALLFSAVVHLVRNVPVMPLPEAPRAAVQTAVSTVTQLACVPYSFVRKPGSHSLKRSHSAVA
jgi:hypothetical protein